MSDDAFHFSVSATFWVLTTAAFRSFGMTAKSSTVATSTVHAVACATHAAYMLLDEGGMSRRSGLHHPQFRPHVMAEVSYYLWDSMAELRGGGSSSSSSPRLTLLRAGFLLHHVVPLLGALLYLPWVSTTPLETQYATSYLVTCITLVHFSTPFVNAKWFMDRRETAPTSLVYRANYVVSLVLFVMLRFVGLVPLLKSVIWLRGLDASSTTVMDVLTQHLPVKCVAGTGVLTALNAVWFVMSLAKVRKVFPR